MPHYTNCIKCTMIFLIDCAIWNAISFSGFLGSDLPHALCIVEVKETLRILNPYISYQKKSTALLSVVQISIYLHMYDCYVHCLDAYRAVTFCFDTSNKSQPSIQLSDWSKRSSMLMPSTKTPVLIGTCSNSTCNLNTVQTIV